jgi:hypothetical protein
MTGIGPQGPQLPPALDPAWSLIIFRKTDYRDYKRTFRATCSFSRTIRNMSTHNPRRKCEANTFTNKPVISLFY